MQDPRYLTAQEAADALGIKVASLYSYVSRGLIRSEETSGKKRTRRYRAEDITKLKQRKALKHDPAAIVADALNWGAPVLESALTLIEGGRFYYRGRDVLSLIDHYTVEQVAALIWTGDLPPDPPALLAHPFDLPPRCAAAFQANRVRLTPIEAFQVLLPLAAADDVAAYDLRPPAVILTGTRILRLLTAIAAGGQATSGDMGTVLQRHWAPDRPAAAALINTALILCADHELNVSSFTARCVASAGSTPYAVVTAGLAALQGVKHGGYTGRVEALFREVRTAAGARPTLVNRLKRGEPIPGFRQPLYPQGDPRGKALLERTTAAYPDSPAVALATAITEAMFDLSGDRPTIDFGLVALARTLELPPGSALALFALGRTIGWLGHAIEQYRSNRLIRPRARYIGEQPA
jgi:citrate synthase